MSELIRYDLHWHKDGATMERAKSGQWAEFDCVQSLLEAERNKIKEMEGALEFLAIHGHILSERKGQYQIMEEYDQQWEPSEWKEICHGSTPLSAIQNAMKDQEGKHE